MFSFAIALPFGVLIGSVPTIPAVLVGLLVAPLIVVGVVIVKDTLENFTLHIEVS